jgi:hypothetical protein
MACRAKRAEALGRRRRRALDAAGASASTMSNKFQLDRTAPARARAPVLEEGPVGTGASPRQRNAAVSALLSREGRSFAVAGATYVAAAAVVAAVQTTAPIDHGWWLVSYLGLVGGLSQALLGSGLVALATSSDAGTVVTERWVRFALWNLGVVTVALADLAEAPAGVLAGSVLLLAALARFTQSCLRIVKRRGRRSVVPWAGLYLALVAFLAGSVVVGTALAGALPGQ